MDVAQIVSKLPQWLDLAGVIMTGIVLGATVLVRVAEVMSSIAPKELDPERIKKAKAIVQSAGDWMARILLHFPTWFKNPKTQQMENLIQKLLEEQATQPVGLVLTKVESVSLEEKKPDAGPVS